MIPLYHSLEQEFGIKVELVTTLKRQATRLLSDLQKYKELILITKHGKPAAYLVNVEDYEFTQKRITILEGIAKGEKAIIEDRTFEASEAREKTSKWLK